MMTSLVIQILLAFSSTLEPLQRRNQKDHRIRWSQPESERAEDVDNAGETQKSKTRRSWKEDDDTVANKIPVK